MSYVREVLQPGEEIRFRTNVHWLVYLPALVMFVVGVAFALWYTAAASQHFMLLILSGLSAAAGVLLFIPAWPKRFGTEIAVTDRRVIYKTGLAERGRESINSRSGLWFRDAHHSGDGRDDRGAAEHSLAPSVPKRHHGSVRRCDQTEADNPPPPDVVLPA